MKIMNLENDFKHSDITELIIKCFYNVYNTLGYGFLEKVYENAMLIELEKEGLNALQQKHIKVFYDKRKVGDYYADLLVEELIIVELKTAKAISIENENQLINYLKATEMEVGLLLNFGKKPEFKRKVFSNRYK